MKSLLQREKELTEEKAAKIRKEEERKQREAAAIRELSDDINAYTGSKGLQVEQVVTGSTLQLSRHSDARTQHKLIITASEQKDGGILYTIGTPPNFKDWANVTGIDRPEDDVLAGLLHWFRTP